MSPWKPIPYAPMNRDVEVWVTDGVEEFLPPGETTEPRTPPRVHRADQRSYACLRAPRLCGARAAPLDAAQGAAGPSRRRTVDRRCHRLGSAIRPLRLSQACRAARAGGLDRQRQTGRADLETGGAQGPSQTTQARSALAGRRIMHSAAAGAPQSRLVLRLCGGPDT